MSDKFNYVIFILIFGQIQVNAKALLDQNYINELELIASNKGGGGCYSGGDCKGP